MAAHKWKWPAFWLAIGVCLVPEEGVARLSLGDRAIGMSGSARS